MRYTILATYDHREARRLDDDDYAAVRRSAGQRFDLFVDGRERKIVCGSSELQVGRKTADVLVRLLRAPNKPTPVLALSPRGLRDEGGSDSARKQVDRAWRKVEELLPDVRECLVTDAVERRSGRTGPIKYFAPSKFAGIRGLRWGVSWDSEFDGDSRFPVATTAIEPSSLQIRVLSVERAEPTLFTATVLITNPDAMKAESVPYAYLSFGHVFWRMVDVKETARQAVEGVGYGYPKWWVEELYDVHAHLDIDQMFVPARGYLSGQLSFSPDEGDPELPGAGRQVAIHFGLVDGGEHRVEVTLPNP